MFLVAVLAVIVLGVLLALVILYPHGIGIGSQSYITISAIGSAQAVPQLVTLYIIMNGTGPTSAQAASNLSSTLNDFNSSIGQYIGGNYSRVTTESYSLQKYNRSYVATESVYVSLPNVLNVSSALGSLSSLPNVYVTGTSTSFTPEQTAALTNEALEAALANATIQAASLAPNKTLTVRNISSYHSYVYPLYGPGLVASASIIGTSQSPIFFSGRQEVTEQIIVVFSHS